MLNVKSFGADGSGSVDDRESIQRAFDHWTPGEVVWFPNGRYRLGQHLAFGCLTVPPGLAIRGESREGVVLQAADHLRPSCSVLWCENSPDVSIQDLTVDGNRTGQDVNQWRHCLFAKKSPRLSLRHVTLQNAGGDGVEIVDGSDDASVFDVLCRQNTRNGLTMGGGTRGGVFSLSQFVGNGTQQFDSEGGVVHDVTIRSCLFDGFGVSDDYVLTMTGMGMADAQSRGWTVTDNVVNGSALMLWIADVIYARNSGSNSSGKPSVRVFRTCDQIRIQDNVLHSSSPAVFDAGGLVYIMGTGGVGQTPGGVSVERNHLTSTAPTYGVTAVSARDVSVTDNVIDGAGAGSGVFVRAVHLDVPTERVTIRGNTFRGFADFDVLLGGNSAADGAARINRVDIDDNEFTSPLSLGDDFNTARMVTSQGNRGENIVRPPGGQPQDWGDGSRWVIRETS